jgi:hypothetical protein
VSIVILDPLKLKNQLTLLERVEFVTPVGLYLTAVSGSELRIPRYSWLKPLTKTDVLDPRALSIVMPAFSKAWYTFSRINRCCGSRVRSSVLEILKNGLSKNAGSSER